MSHTTMCANFLQSLQVFTQFAVQVTGCELLNTKRQDTVHNIMYKLDGWNRQHVNMPNWNTNGINSLCTSGCVCVVNWQDVSSKCSIRSTNPPSRTEDGESECLHCSTGYQLHIHITVWEPFNVQPQNWVTSPDENVPLTDRTCPNLNRPNMAWISKHEHYRFMPSASWHLIAYTSVTYYNKKLYLKFIHTNL